MKKNISWDEIEEITFKIIEQLIDNDKKYTGVYGVPRGGLIPAIIISHNMNLPLLMAPIKGSIIIDDIVDSGATMEAYGNYENKELTKCALFARSNTSHLVNISIVENNDWIVFPWETRNTEL